MLRSKKFAAAIGALAGFVFTRLPYMEDGNLLITTVIVLSAASITLLLWLGIQRVIDR
jgi:hypothetical protein